MADWLRFYGPALLAWAFIVGKLYGQLRRGYPSSGTVWLVLVGLACSLTLQAPGPYHALSSLTGVPNIARLVSHLLMLVVVWSAQALLSRLSNQDTPLHRYRWGLAGVAVVMSVLFWLAPTPVDDVRFAGRYAAAPWVLEYWLVFVVALAPAFYNVVRLGWRYSRLSGTGVEMLGLRLIVAGAASSLVYHVHKAVFFAARRFSFWYPEAFGGLLDRFLPLISAVTMLVGATIMRNGMDALHAIDAHQPVIDAAFPATALELLDSKGNRLSLNPMASGAQTIKRAVLYRVLHDEATRRGISLVHGKRLVAASSGSGVVASFEDGSSAEGDVLVGADGLHSATRSIIDPSCPAPRFTGLTVAYGYTRATSFTPATSAYRMISGQQAFFGYTTAPDGETWWFSRAPGVDLAQATRELFVSLLAHDETPAAEIVRTTPDPFFSNAYDVPSTPHWHNGRMVLVGDAAHAASPAAGQGASMALEDSVILAKCLRDISGVQAAFETYTSLRRARVERLVATSAEQGNANRVSQPSDRTWLYDHHIDWNAPILP